MPRWAKARELPCAGGLPGGRMALRASVGSETRLIVRIDSANWYNDSLETHQKGDSFYGLADVDIYGYGGMDHLPVLGSEHGFVYSNNSGYGDYLLDWYGYVFRKV